MNAFKLIGTTAVSLVVIAIGTIADGKPTTAAEIDYPVTFAEGNTLTASDLNANFDEVKTVVNGSAVVVAFAGESKVVGLGPTASEIQIVSIVTSGPGQIVVSFSAGYSMIHDGESPSQIQVGISESPDTGLGPLPSRRLLNLAESFPIGEFSGSVVTQAAFSVSAASEYTYYIMGLGISNNGSSILSVVNPSTQALFVPDP